MVFLSLTDIVCHKEKNIGRNAVKNCTNHNFYFPQKCHEQQSHGPKHVHDRHHLQESLKNHHCHLKSYPEGKRSVRNSTQIRNTYMPR